MNSGRQIKIQISHSRSYSDSDSHKRDSRPTLFILVGILALTLSLPLQAREAKQSRSDRTHLRTVQDEYEEVRTDFNALKKKITSKQTNVENCQADITDIRERLEQISNTITLYNLPSRKVQTIKFRINDFAHELRTWEQKLGGR